MTFSFTHLINFDGVIYCESPNIRMKQSVEEFFGEQHSAKTNRVANMTFVVN